MSFFKRFILALALIGALAAPASATQVCYFGECGTTVSSPAAPAVSPAAPTIRVLATFGSWQVIADKEGHRMIVDSFDHSKLVIGQENGAFQFVFVDSSWDLPANGTAEAKIIVDGRTFVGTATAVSSHMVILKDVSLRVMQAMYHGDKATIIIGKASWDLSLPNAVRAIDAVDTIKTSAE